ncbi:MAG: glycosyltransferase family 4 protein [Chloroflexi bacterium]|nr:MAG: glycosyltransferase family 4 protein [Chloroflexota bacterium]
MAPPKIAIVADWLTDFGGAERVILAMHEAFPDAPIYTSVYQPKPELAAALKGADIRTTTLQQMPSKLRKLHKFFPMLRVRAFQELDLSEFDIILSSSSAEAKQVPPLRKADYQAAQNVDVFIANSSEVQTRIKKYYDKPSTIIHPPVDVSRFDPARLRSDYYVAVGRQVPYKRIDLAVQAATKLGVKLKVFGNGSEHDRLVKLAGPTIEFYTNRFGDASDSEVTRTLNSAKGYIFPAEEDFGIVQVEALAAGTPVIGYGRGGTLDIVQDNETGVLFDQQTVESVSPERIE